MVSAGPGENNCRLKDNIQQAKRVADIGDLPV
jgi:hypothetical protein